MRSVAIAVSALACALANQAHAQSSQITFEANVAEAFEVTGAEVGVGWRLSAGNFHLTPGIGAFVYQADNDRYVRETFSNGQSRCRDRTNGQFARDGLCEDADAYAYGRVEATANFGNVEVGAGYRIAEDESVFYGTASVRVSERWHLKANAGSDYVGLGLAFRR